MSLGGRGKPGHDDGEVGAASRPPYMSAGQIETLADALAHYNRAPAAPLGHTELVPLSLTPEELAALEAFLRTLDLA